MKRTNAEISKGNNDIMEKHRQRRQQQQSSSYKTPDNPIRDLKFLPAVREVSKKRRMDGKLKGPHAIRIRANPKPPIPRRNSHPDVVDGAKILASLKDGSRKKKKGTKRTKKRSTKKKRTKRTKKKRKKKRKKK